MTAARAVRGMVGLVLAAPLPLLGQSSVRADVDTADVTVGDRITFTVSVEHPLEAQVMWPDSFDLAPFEVLQARTLPTASTGETATSTAVLTLTVFELGQLEIPSLDVEVVGPDGTRETVATDVVAIEVVSVGKDESGDIRDIRGPLGIPLSTWRLLLWGLLPVLAAALLYTVVRWIRPRKDRTPRPALAPPPRPPHEVALEALAALEASPLLENGRVKEYHIEVSDILRTYVEARFRVDALEMTTVEVLAGLEQTGVDPALRDGLRAFLDQCDLVKFAKVRPAPSASRQVLELGRRLVLESVTRPASGEQSDMDDPTGGVEAVAAGAGAGS